MTEDVLSRANVRLLSGDQGRTEGMPQVGQQINSVHRKDKSRAIAQAADTGLGESDRTEKLDGSYRSERQPADGEIETHIHAGQNHA